MADSNITKRALASALRELMEEVPFDKIQVTHICERCNMNRKSFYYHFRDKYDLLNWIFDTEMISMIRDYTGKEPLEQYVEILHEICNYLYKNRDFYRNALKIQGQNSFSDHFREYLRPLTKLRLVHLIGDWADDEFILDFFTDATVYAIERWLSEKNCMSPDQFLSRLLNVVRICTNAMHKELNQGE